MPKTLAKESNSGRPQLDELDRFLAVSPTAGIRFALACDASWSAVFHAPNDSPLGWSTVHRLLVNQARKLKRRESVAPTTPYLLIVCHVVHLPLDERALAPLVKSIVEQFLGGRQAVDPQFVAPGYELRAWGFSQQELDAAMPRVQRALVAKHERPAPAPEAVAVSRELSTVRSDVERTQQYLRSLLEGLLAEVGGKELSSHELRDQVAQQIQQLLELTELRIKCPTCGEPASLRSVKRRPSDPGRFTFSHPNVTTHGGPQQLPSGLELVAAPERGRPQGHKRSQGR